MCFLGGGVNYSRFAPRAIDRFSSPQVGLASTDRENRKLRDNGLLAMRISSDLSDLLFPALFCLIFIGLGGEHMVADELIQQLMPLGIV